MGKPKSYKWRYGDRRPNNILTSVSPTKELKSYHNFLLCKPSCSPIHPYGVWSLSCRQTCIQLILVWLLLLVLSCSCPFVDLLLPLLPFIGVQLVLWSNAPPWCVIFVTLSDFHSNHLGLAISFGLVLLLPFCWLALALAPISWSRTCTLVQCTPMVCDLCHIVGLAFNRGLVWYSWLEDLS